MTTIKGWQPLRGSPGVQYLVSDGISDKWITFDEMGNKKPILDFWKKYFIQERFKIKDIFIDAENQKTLRIQLNNKEIILNKDEMDKERLIEFLRKIPPTAQFSIDGKLVTIKSKNSHSQIKISWMKKCQKNTINSFVKYLTSPDVQKVLKLNQQSKEKKVTKVRRLDNPKKSENRLKRARAESTTLDHKLSHPAKVEKTINLDQAKIQFKKFGNNIPIKSTSFIIAGLISIDACYHCIVLISTKLGKIPCHRQIPIGIVSQMHPKNQKILKKLVQKFDKKPVYYEKLQKLIPA